MNEFHEAFHKALERLVKENNLRIEELTEKQTAEAIRQAIACGDFTRLVCVDGGSQAVIYLPYAREQELTAKVMALQEKLDAIRTLVEN